MRAVLDKPMLADLRRLLPSSKRGQLWAIDLETRGTSPTQKDAKIVGIGLADRDGSFYVNTKELPADCREYLLDYLSAVQLVAFNVLFDAQFLLAVTGEWLNWVGCSYGLFKALSTEGWDGQSWDLETAQRDVLGWEVSNKDALAAALKERGLTKANMAELPTETLGPYCALDADAAYQLWEVLTETCANRDFHQLLTFHQEVFMAEVKLLAEQHLRGIEIDTGRLTSYHADLNQRIEASREAFLSHQEVAPHIARFNGDVLSRHLAAEPPRLTKKGEETARWKNWNEKTEQVRSTNHFNVNSKQSLEWLFFDCLGYDPKRTTETGRRSVDRKSLPHFGDPGRSLNAYNLLVKERGYVEALSERTTEFGVLHPQFNSYGTVTGRLSGSGGISVHQMPKSKGFLECWRARDGFKLVQLDLTAIEPTILAEFSQDPMLLSLYGKDAPENDLYLFVSAQIPGLGNNIKKYYDPYNPTPESIALAKKHCKQDRAVSKVVCLASNYKAGPAKIHETLTFSRIDISFAEVRRIHKAYWELFQGVERFERELLRAWHDNGGFIWDALGCPIAIDEKYLKDINNRFCQRSGHAILQLYLKQLVMNQRDYGVQLFPWNVDNQDETINEVREEDADKALKLYRDSLDRVNDELGMGVLIKGEPMVATTFAEIKCED